MVGVDENLVVGEVAATDVMAGDIEFDMLTLLHPKGLDLNQRRWIEFLDRVPRKPPAALPCFVESVQWQMKDKIVS